MRDIVFRANDIRGEMGHDMTIADMGQLADSISYYLHTYAPQVQVLALARDGRTHSPEIFEHMCAAFLRNGYDVLNLGLCPTPVTQYMLQLLGVDFGITITASHNGPTYNGCKFVYKNRPFWGERIQLLRQIHQKGLKIKGSRSGTCIDYTDSAQRYVLLLAQKFPHLQNLSERIVFDCGNGATGAVMPLLVEVMGWHNAELLYTEIDGNFPHHEADPVVPENMHDLARSVIETKAAYGIGFDGDGDRMGVVTADGRHVRGDLLLALYARDVLRSNPCASIVYDGKCSNLVAQVIRKEGGTPFVSPSGHAMIREAMCTYGALFGGELSCHFFFADRYFGYDDGVYAALRLIDLLQREHQPLSSLLELFPQSYVTEEWRFSYTDEGKQHFVDDTIEFLRNDERVTELSLLDGVRLSTADGWLLLRASQTQPVLCMRCEASTPQGIELMGEIIYDIFQRHGLAVHQKEVMKKWLDTALWDRFLI